MTSYIMTDMETRGWQSLDRQYREAQRATVRYRAQRKADESGETVELFTDASESVDVFVSRFPLASR